MANNPFISDDEDAKKYFISEDEVNSASDNIDLLAPADRDAEAAASSHSLDTTSGNTIMNELEMTTSTLVSNATVNPRNIRNRNPRHDDGSGDEADDESDYGIHLDDEIVNKVLGSSDERIRKRDSDVAKKYCFYGILGLCSFLLLVSLFDPDFAMRGYIAAEGSAYHYHDRGDFSGEEDSKEEVLEESIQFDESDYKSVFMNAVDVKGPDPFAPDDGEVPFYYSLRNACPTVEDILSECLDLAVASEKSVPPSVPKDHVSIFFIYYNSHDRHFNLNEFIMSTQLSFR